MDKPSPSIKFFGHNNDEWIGVVVSFDNQKQQIKGTDGWGLRAKVAIMGNHPSDNTIQDEEIAYAIVRLGVTDGSGGGNRSKSIRLSQGDVVVGKFLDGGDKQQPVIEGVLGRTSGTRYGKGRFDSKTGFLGGLKPGNLLGRHETNETSDPPCTPKPLNINSDKSKERKTPEDSLAEVGIDPGSGSQLNEKPEPKNSNLTEEEQNEVMEAEAQAEADAAAAEFGTAAEADSTAAADRRERIRQKQTVERALEKMSADDIQGQAGGVAVNRTPTSDELQQFESEGYKFVPDSDSDGGGRIVKNVGQNYG